jgi:hypothetical protein
MGDDMMITRISMADLGTVKGAIRGARHRRGATSETGYEETAQVPPNTKQSSGESDI